MNIKTQCPVCGQHYEVDDAYNGQLIECQKCKHQFLIASDIEQNNFKFCQYCGSKIAASAQKCMNCGEWVVPHSPALKVTGGLLFLLSSCCVMFLLFCVFSLAVSDALNPIANRISGVDYRAIEQSYRGAFYVVCSAGFLLFSVASIFSFFITIPVIKYAKKKGVSCIGKLCKNIFLVFLAVFLVSIFWSYVYTSMRSDYFRQKIEEIEQSSLNSQKNGANYF